MSLQVDKDVDAALAELYAKAQAAGSKHIDWERSKAALATPPNATSLRFNQQTFPTVEAAVQAVIEQITPKYAHRSLDVPNVTPHESLDDVLVIPCRAQLDTEPAPLEVYLGTGCAMAVLRGADVYAPGIRGMMPGIGEGDRVSLWSDTQNICTNGAHSLEGPKTFVGNGVAVVSRREFYKGTTMASGLAIRVTEPLYDSPPLSNSASFFLQNLPSSAVTHALDPQPGETILDMSAAPGGKTSHIAWRMQGRGRLVACERSKKKAAKLQETLAAMGIKDPFLTVVASDARKLLPKTEATRGAQHYQEASFDRVLLDGPCSGLGQRPCLVNTLSLNNFNDFAPFQKKLFATAIRLVKPGGRLVYSTCTTSPLENEEVVAWALATYPDKLQLASPAIRLGGHGLLGYGLSEEQVCSVQRWEPADNADTIGFFFAVFSIAP